VGPLEGRGTSGKAGQVGSVVEPWEDLPRSRDYRPPDSSPPKEGALKDHPGEAAVQEKIPSEVLEGRSRKLGPAGILTLAALICALKAGDLIALAWGGADLVARNFPSLYALRQASANWDGHWYLGIAASGYSYLPGTDSNVAFFPVFPLTMRFVGEALSIDYLLAGSLVSVAAGLVFPLIFYRVVAARFDRQTAFRSVLLVVAFPTAFFFVLPYPESLFALFCVAALGFGAGGSYGGEAGRTQAESLGRLDQAGSVTAGFLSGMTKIFAVLLPIALLCDRLEQLSWDARRFCRSLGFGTLARTFSPWLGLGIWCMYLWFRFGEPFAFYKAQMDGWPHSRTTVLQPVLQTFLRLFDPRPYLGGTRPDLYWAYLLDTLTVVAVVLVAAKAWRLLPRSWSIFWLGSSSLALLSGTTNSFARYQLALFPFFVGMALSIRSRRIFASVVVVMGASQLILAYLFGKGWWVG
jgi:hypothetical protein